MHLQAAGEVVAHGQISQPGNWLILSSIGKGRRDGKKAPLTSFVCLSRRAFSLIIAKVIIITTKRFIAYCYVRIIVFLLGYGDMVYYSVKCGLCSKATRRY